MQGAFSVDDIEAKAPSLTMFERHIEDVGSHKHGGELSRIKSDKELDAKIGRALQALERSSDFILGQWEVSRLGGGGRGLL